MDDFEAWREWECMILRRGIDCSWANCGSSMKVSRTSSSSEAVAILTFWVRGGRCGREKLEKTGGLRLRRFGVVEEVGASEEEEGPEVAPVNGADSESEGSSSSCGSDWPR